jgi:hypothetical protein
MQAVKRFSNSPSHKILAIQSTEHTTTSHGHSPYPYTHTEAT